MAPTTSPKGVLLMAYGSPDSLSGIPEYLKRLMGGREPNEDEISDLTEKFRRIGGSPLLWVTERQAEALQRQLNQSSMGGYSVRIGMKNWNPYVEEAVAQMASEGISEVIGVVLSPHFSKLTVGGYESRLREAAASVDPPIAVDVVRNWYREHEFIHLVSSNVKATLAVWPPKKSRVFFTAHSLPLRAPHDGDEYVDQVHESAKLVATAAELPDWEVAFQSAKQTPERWIGPPIVERLEAFKREGGERAIVAPIGFVADHLEILWDIDIECRAHADALGLELLRIHSPNDDTRFIYALANVILDRS